MSITIPPRRVDELGRCCGRKPMRYMRDRHLFCPRCDAAYDFDGNQITNWAYKKTDSGFLPTYPDSEDAARARAAASALNAAERE